MKGLLHPEWRPEDVFDLLGKSMDLGKAYRQIPVSAMDGPFAIIAVWNPTKRIAELCESVAMPFGARNAVSGFNWVARAIDWILTIEFSMSLTHYFDDYPVVEPRLYSQSRRLGRSLKSVRTCWDGVSNARTARTFRSTRPLTLLEFEWTSLSALVRG